MRRGMPGKSDVRALDRTLPDYVAERLREQILAGDLVAGGRIPLDDIADDLGVSAIPVREALRILATEGLVVPLPRRGFTVAPTTIDDLDETYRLRLVLEPLAVLLAVPRLDEGDVARLRRELELLEEAFRAGHWPDHRLHHRAFHFGIYEKCNSTWLLRFTDMLWLNSERYQRMTTRIAGELNQRAKEHYRILEACEAGAAETASYLMKDHLSRAADSLRGYIAEQEHVRAD